MGKYCILTVNYPDCKNYEGTKILVYKALLEDVLAQKSLDPHFSESKEFLSPIARFIPTKAGLAMAHQFCKSMTKLYG